jgi:hypothetical protein
MLQIHSISLPGRCGHRPLQGAFLDLKQLGKLEFEEQWRYRAGQGSNDQIGTVHVLSAATRRLDKPEFEDIVAMAEMGVCIKLKLCKRKFWKVAFFSLW